MSEWINTKDRLPEDRTYVLVRYEGGNWKDRDDQNGCKFKVMKFVRVNPEDSYEPNNPEPYKWNDFGPGGFFGHEVDYWMPIPKIGGEHERT